MRVTLALVVWGFLTAAVGRSFEAHTQTVVSPYLPDYGRVSAPYAWVRMCKMDPGLCPRYSVNEAPDVTPYLMHQLNVVSLKVNKAVTHCRHARQMLCS